MHMVPLTTLGLASESPIREPLKNLGYTSPRSLYN
jgi:hypothetical protein